MIYKTLNNGTVMPALGYGTYKITEEFCPTRCVLDALEVGYRHVDTATFYHNEAQIGEAIASCGIDRQELFLSDKLWTNVTSEEETFRAVDVMLFNLKTDYLDLLMIHWPTPFNATVWKAMEKLYHQGVVKSIGVSNFLPHHIDEILQTGKIMPVINQVELHPIFQQVETRKYCDGHDILVEAWSPLMRGSALTDETLQTIADKYGKSIAQLIVRYDLQLGLSVLPKTTHKCRMKENFDVFDFEISPDDMKKIAAMDKNLRQYRHPDHHGF